MNKKPTKQREVKRIATHLYENQPECMCAITKERRAEACYDIAQALVDKFSVECEEVEWLIDDLSRAGGLYFSYDI